MARGVEGDLNSVSRERLAVGDRFDRNLAEAFLQDRRRVPRWQT